ncbi:MAG TPA: hypothetical protein VK524_20605 [Polyangiaceae bacterium]|nr:hypothetical protein [Polyangiaceae bacterium]
MPLRTNFPETALLYCCALAILPGCGSDEDSHGEKYLGLEKPANGFHVRSQGELIRAGEDVEYCEVAELPGEADKEYYVSGIELGNGLGSHHLIVEVAEPGSVADQKLRSLSIGDRVPCFSAESAYGQGMYSLFGIQQPYGRVDYPPGVGRVVYGKQRAVFDYHYLNTTSEDVRSQSAINIHVTNGESITHIVDGFGFYNWTIDVPAGKTASFKGECTFNRDVMVAGLARHTHRWGTDYSVWNASDPDDAAPFWTSTDWEHDVNYGWEEPRLFRAGEGFRFECNYNNTETHRLRFGTQARDEMCILFGLAWDAGDERVIPSQSCDLTWEDERGVAQDTDAKGGYPAPPPEVANACLQGAANGAEPSECLKCQCNSCGGALVKCFADEDCREILNCFQGCSAEPDCAQQCQPIIDQHSSAVGLTQQMSSCLQSRCDEQCGG